MTVFETAYAKLNLALHVRKKREDGYHKLETIFAFADLGDEIALTASDDFSLEIAGPFAGSLANDSENLILRAATAMQAHFGVQGGAAIRLTKNLPVAAGLGGGSADAAAAARGLARLWGLDVDHVQIVAAIGHLGADIPACVESKTIRGEELGDQFSQVTGNPLSNYPILIANPCQPLSTASVFAAWDGRDRGPLALDDVMTASLEGRNDLEKAAISLCPAIADGLDSLAHHGELLCRMSGSGASIFAIYNDEALRDRAAEAFISNCPDWWTMKAALR